MGKQRTLSPGEQIFKQYGPVRANPYQATPMYNSEYAQQYEGLPVSNETLELGVQNDLAFTTESYSSQIAKNVGAALVNTVGFAAATVMSIPNFIDNQFNEGNDRLMQPINEMQNAALEDFQSYQNPGNENQSVMEWLTPSWISGNTKSFWGDLIEQSGIIAGTTLGANALLGAARFLPGIAAAETAIGTAAKGALSKMIKPATLLGEQLGMSKAVANTLNSQKFINGLASAARTTGLNAVQSYTEALFQGLDGERNFIEDKIKEYETKFGYRPEGVELQNIENTARELKDTTFGLNMAGLMISNTPFTKAFFGGPAPNFLSRLGKLGSTLDAAGKIVTKELDFLKGKSPYLAKPINFLAYKNPIALSEGFEEIYQMGVEKGMDNYYTNKLNTKDFEANFSNISKALGAGAKSIFTTEGLKAFIAGAGVGGVFQGVGNYREARSLNQYLDKKTTIIDPITKQEKEITNREDILSDINNMDKAVEGTFSLDPLAKNPISLGQTFGERVQQFVTDNNNLQDIIKTEGSYVAYDQAQRTKFDALYPYVKKGYKDVIVSKIEGVYEDLNKAELSDEQRQTLSKQKQAALADVNTVESFVNTIDNVFYEQFADPTVQKIHKQLKDIAVYHLWNTENINRQSKELSAIYGDNIFEDEIAKEFTGSNINTLLNKEIKKLTPIDSEIDINAEERAIFEKIKSSDNPIEAYFAYKQRNKPAGLISSKDFLVLKKQKEYLQNRLKTNSDVISNLYNVKSDPLTSAAFLFNYHGQAENIIRETETNLDTKKIVNDNKTIVKSIVDPENQEDVEKELGKKMEKPLSETDIKEAEAVVKKESKDSGQNLDEEKKIKEDFEKKKAELLKKKEAKIAEVTKEKPKSLKDLLGKKVKFGGDVYTIVQDPSKDIEFFILENRNNILEIDQSYEFFDKDIVFEIKNKYTIAFNSNLSVTVNGVTYNILTDKNGSIIGLESLSKSKNIIKNEALLVAVEIERNKVIFNEPLSEKNIEEVNEEIKINPNAAIILENIYNKNFTDTVAEALEKLYEENFDGISEQEKLSLYFWLEEAFTNLNKQRGRITDQLLKDAEDTLTIIAHLLYENKNLETKIEENETRNTEQKTTNVVKVDESNVKQKAEEINNVLSEKKEDAQKKEKEEINVKVEEINKEYEEQLEALEKELQANLEKKRIKDAKKKVDLEKTSSTSKTIEQLEKEIADIKKDRYYNSPANRMVKVQKESNNTDVTQEEIDEIEAIIEKAKELGWDKNRLFRQLRSMGYSYALNVRPEAYRNYLEDRLSNKTNIKVTNEYNFFAQLDAELAALEQPTSTEFEIAAIETLLDKALTNKPIQYDNNTVDSDFGQVWNTGKYSLSDIYFLSNRKEFFNKETIELYNYLISLNPTLKSIKFKNNYSLADIVRGVASGLHINDIKYFVEDLNGTAENQSEQDKDLNYQAFDAYYERFGEDDKVSFVFTPETSKRVISNTKYDAELKAVEGTGTSEKPKKKRDKKEDLAESKVDSKVFSNFIPNKIVQDKIKQLVADKALALSEGPLNDFLFETMMDKDEAIAMITEEFDNKIKALRKSQRTTEANRELGGTLDDATITSEILEDSESHLYNDIGLIRTQLHTGSKEIFTINLKDSQGNLVPAFTIQNNKDNLLIDLDLFNQFLEQFAIKKDTILTPYYNQLKQTESKMPFINFLEMLIGMPQGNEIFDFIQNTNFVLETTAETANEIADVGSILKLFNFPKETLDSLFQRLLAENNLYSILKSGTSTEEILSKLDITFKNSNAILLPKGQEVLIKDSGAIGVVRIVEGKLEGDSQIESILDKLKDKGIAKKRLDGFYAVYPKDENGNYYVRGAKVSMGYDTLSEAGKKDFKVGFYYKDKEGKNRNDYWQVTVNSEGQYELKETSGKGGAILDNYSKFAEWLANQEETLSTKGSFFEKGADVLEKIFNDGRVDAVMYVNNSVKILPKKEAFENPPNMQKNGVTDPPGNMNELLDPEGVEETTTAKFSFKIEKKGEYETISNVITIENDVYTLKPGITEEDVEFFLSESKKRKPFLKKEDLIKNSGFYTKNENPNYSTMSDYQLNKIKEFIEKC